MSSIDRRFMIIAMKNFMYKFSKLNIYESGVQNGTIDGLLFLIFFTSTKVSTIFIINAQIIL